MRNYLLKYFNQKTWFCIAITTIWGCLNHFLYDWHPSAFVALFCPVNESTWEHLKLIFFPFFFISIIIWLFSRPKLLPFFYYRFLSVFCGMSAIIILFYTYTGIIGRHFLFLDILIFFLSVLIAFKLPDNFHKKKLHPPPANVVFSLWIITSLLFFAFTCFPPDIGLFFSSI